MFGGDVGVGRARLRTARACGNEIQRPQLADDVAAHLLAEQLRELAAGDRLKIRNPSEDQTLGARQPFRVRSPHRQVDGIGELPAGAQMLAAGHGDKVIGAAAPKSLRRIWPAISVGEPQGERFGVRALLQANRRHLGGRRDRTPLP